MNINTRALMIGAGIATVIQVIITLLNSASSFLIADPTTALDPTNPDAAALAGVSSLVGLLVCCCGMFTDAIGGVAYSHFHKQDAGGIEVQDGAVGGALTGLIARIISSLIGLCVSLLIIPQLLETAIDPELAGLIGASAAIGGVVGICINVVLGLVFGAVGGAVYAAVQGNK